ncbi:F-box protein 28 [Nesidiocoris tenuis]|uniref:F-box protein 28 n=1 Tax=Nesidiocoris tenuis TaxID=355587 RepID=A0ABN7ADT0_9HEMI|nr:F-box protein 28 [Nesidiocoris tenuis]
MSAINLADMPEVVLEHIFSFLTYDNIAQNRIVSRKFNTLGAKMLNKGYYMADRYHEKTLKAIKAKLPRRESERRVHPLARQCDILIAIETRLSMLAMTFSKWIDANVCCFIPGKVIDEIMRVLRCVANNPCPPRAHEILQELRDISSMAMEHFDERILPILKSNIRVPPYFNLAEPLTCATAPSRTASLGFVRYKPRSACLQQAERHTSVSTLELSEQKTIDVLLSVKINKQNMVIAKQNREIAELRKLLDEHDAKLRDLQEKISKSQALPSTSVIVTRQAGKRKRVIDKNSSRVASDDALALKRPKSAVAKGSKD